MYHQASTRSTCVSRLRSRIASDRSFPPSPFSFSAGSCSALLAIEESRVAVYGKIAPPDSDAPGLLTTQFGAVAICLKQLQQMAVFCVLLEPGGKQQLDF